MKKLLAVIILSFCIHLKGNTQDYLLVGTIEQFTGNFTTDYLGNIFHYQSGDVIRFERSGQQTGIFSSREYGDVSYVDATNPMKILVVYGTFSKAVLLDNSMSANTTFDLSFAGIPVVSLICTSRDGGFWFFDPQSKQLKKMNDQLEVTIEGTNLRQVTDTDVVPERIHDSGNWVVLYSSNFGFMIFDRYGTYYKTIKSVTNSDFQVSNDEIMFKEGNKMNITNIKNGKVQSFILPENSENDACRVESKHIYIQRINVLNIYSY